MIVDFATSSYVRWPLWLHQNIPRKYTGRNNILFSRHNIYYFLEIVTDSENTLVGIVSPLSQKKSLQCQRVLIVM